MQETGEALRGCGLPVSWLAPFTCSISFCASAAPITSKSHAVLDACLVKRWCHSPGECDALHWKRGVSKKWRGNGPDWLRLVLWFAKLTAWSKPLQSTSTRSCLFFAAINLCLGHGSWRSLKRSIPMSLVLVTWFFQKLEHVKISLPYSPVFFVRVCWVFLPRKS